MTHTYTETHAYKTPQVKLITYTNMPLETVYSVWKASKDEEPLMTPEEVRARVPAEEVRELFRAVIQQRIPVGEHVDFVFMFENVSVSWREQAVRHRIGVNPSPERLGVDFVEVERIPDLADSSWWSQCFTGDTRIRLLDGTAPTLEELSDRGEEFWVYSCDASGRLVPGHGHSARKTGTKRVVEVELDNGERVRCTEDHLWLGREGEYIEARSLVAGTSLMPLYTRDDKYGYEQAFDPASGRWVYTHQRVDSELNGPLPEGQVIHHASFRKSNNDPRWLERMEKIAHISLHAAIVIERMESDPVAHSIALSRGQKRAWASMSEDERGEWRARAKRARNAIDTGTRDLAARRVMESRWSDPAWRSKMLPILAGNGTKTRGRKDTDETRKNKATSAKHRFARDGAVAGFNHKVVSIRVLDEQADVYDITVDKHHNFALASGVFVHNSMRIQNMGKFAHNRAYRMPESVLNHPDGGRLLSIFEGTMQGIEDAYNELVKAGVPMEDARELIPLGAQHRISWRLNIGALQHIVGKRGCWILQLGIWGPVIEGMIRELVEKVDPIFGELVTPPCLRGDEFTGCIYMEENRRRYTGDDKHAPCPLHFTHHFLEEAGDIDAQFHPEDPKYHQRHAVPMAHEMRERAEAYRAFWGRDPYSGKRLRVL